MEEIRATAGETISEIFTRAERITGLAILTLIYRTIEPDIATGTVLSSQCISTALRALSEHQECMRLLEHTEHNMMDFYVQWALLSAPFVPYIVIFCLAIETSSSLHLTKLASVVHATEKVACNYNDAYGKQLAIFKLMYDVACKWIKAKNASSGTRGTESYSTQILSPLKQPAGTG
ncbi:fungal specific transcription protein, partial [Penicillium cosmopolitanum]